MSGANALGSAVGRTDSCKGENSKETRPRGRIDGDKVGRLVLHRPDDIGPERWDRVVRSLARTADVLVGDRVIIGASRVSILRRHLRSGAAAGCDWRWSSRATTIAERAERDTETLRRLVRLTVDQQAAWPTDLDLAKLGFNRLLRPFQRAAVARLLTAGGGADFSVPGSGKTAVAYALWTALRILGRIHALIVVAPPSAFEAWQDEAVACFRSEHLPVVRVRPDRLSNSDQVVVINYERLADPGTFGMLRAWSRNRRILVVFDEAHRAKAGLNSRRGAAATVLARLADASMVLTGTPMPNRESDLISIFDLVWPGHGERLVLGELANRRERAFVRVTKADLGLPPMNVRVERVTLAPLHRRVYDAMLEAVDRWATGPAVTAAEAGKALMRLLAAATNPGAVFDPGAPWSLSDYTGPGAELADLLSEPGRHIRSAKIVRAAQIVAQNRALGRKTLVWSNFVDNVRVIGEALSIHNPATVIGATPVDDPAAPSDRVRELNRFRSDSECWVLVATPQTLGEGVSLHHTCTDQVHVDRGYAAGTWLQSIDRTHRLGLAADACVTCTVIEAENTIDTHVARILNSKVAAMAEALEDRTLRPVSDPAIVAGDPVAAVLGDIDALYELFAVCRNTPPFT